MTDYLLEYKSRLILICAFLFQFINTNTLIIAQDYGVDSLKIKANKELIDAIEETTPEVAIIYERELLVRYKDNNQKAATYLELGRMFYSSGNYERSTYYFEKGILLAHKGNDTETLSKLYILLGNAQLVTWNNQKALDAYYEVLDIEGSESYKVIVNPNIAIIRRRMKQLDQALEVCNEALTLVNNTKYKNGTNHINVLTIASEVHLDLQQYDSVLQLADQGLAMSRKLDYKKGLVDLYTKKGAVYFYKEEYPLALEYLTQADSVFKRSNLKNKTLNININYYFARCFAQQKKHKKALDYLQQLIYLADDNERGDHIRLVESYRLMAACYKELGDENNSVYWYEQYGKLNDENQKNKDAVINTIYEKDTALLDKQIATLEDQKAKGKRYTIYIMFLLVISSGVFIALIYRYKKKQSKSKQSFNTLLKRLNNLEDSNQKNKEKTEQLPIDDEKIEEVLKGLQRLEKQEFFLSMDCSLRTMAKKVKTNATYLSKIINKHKGLNFNDYINNLRIEYAVNRLKSDKKFRSFSIKSIATELGYKSDYSFAKHFKSKTGINPSYYIKRIDKL